MFPTILNTFYWALRSQRLHSRPFLRPDQSRGLPHLPCLLLNSVLLRSMPVGKLSSECNTSKFPFFRKFGINNYSEYSDLIFQQFCKGLYYPTWRSIFYNLNCKNVRLKHLFNCWWFFLNSVFCQSCCYFHRINWRSIRQKSITNSSIFYGEFEHEYICCTCICYLAVRIWTTLR